MACVVKKAFLLLNEGKCLLSDHDTYVTASKESHAKFHLACKATRTQGGTKLLGEKMWRLAAIATSYYPWLTVGSQRGRGVSRAWRESMVETSSPSCWLPHHTKKHSSGTQQAVVPRKSYHRKPSVPGSEGGTPCRRLQEGSSTGSWARPAASANIYFSPWQSSPRRSP